MLFLQLHNSLLNIWGGLCSRHIAMPALKVSIQANQPNSFDHWVSLSVEYKQYSDQNQLEKQRGTKIEIRHAWFWGCSATELFEFVKKHILRKCVSFGLGNALKVHLSEIFTHLLIALHFLGHLSHIELSLPLAMGLKNMQWVRCSRQCRAYKSRTKEMSATILGSYF